MGMRVERLLQGLRAAGEPTRLRILVLCAHAELSVGELVHILGQSQPRVSRHLKLMVEANLLERHQEGARAYYRQTEDDRIGELGRTLVDQMPMDDRILTLDLKRLEDIRADRARRAEEYFHLNADKWENLRGLYIDDQQIDNRVREVVSSGVVGELLDIGTGTGRILRLVGDHVRAGIGIDSSRDMLAIARSNLDEADLRNCQVRHADMYRLPFNAGRFDVVTLNMVMRYADDPSATIAEAARVLRPGGRLVITDFAPHDLIELRDEHAHRWLGFSDAEVSRFAANGGLELQSPRYLEGDPLTVCIWVALKPAEANSNAA
ncbi:MAG: metalloregulator ArsR/SmtB family transcription factor [Rhodospirillaceae bacterium]|nr:metalloregulator ArsR/SmtB family transcription factor [Rhodospirillaceae bacterium]